MTRPEAAWPPIHQGVLREVGVRTGGLDKTEEDFEKGEESPGQDAETGVLEGYHPRDTLIALMMKTYSG